MSDIDAVIGIAKKTLLINPCPGNNNCRLWYRTLRVVHNVEHIINLEELIEADIPIDRFSLTAAAYFSDSALVPKDGSIVKPAHQPEIRTAIELSAQIAAEKLSAVLSCSRTVSISRIITESANRFTKTTEAMILSDARNLDDMGAVGIFSELGAFLSDGKELSELLNSWRRKNDYRYWDARLKESFRFSSVRQLARQRFKAVASFMNQLEVEISASDMKKLIPTGAGI